MKLDTKRRFVYSDRNARACCKCTIFWSIITMSHVVDSVRRTVDAGFNSGVASGSAWEIFKHWSWFILITLQAIIQCTIGLIEWLPCDPCPHTNREAVLSSIEGVVGPDLSALVTESYLFNTFVRPPSHAAKARRRRSRRSVQGTRSPSPPGTTLPVRDAMKMQKLRKTKTSSQVCALILMKTSPDYI